MLSLLFAVACLVIILVFLIYIKIEVSVELIENENQRKLTLEILPEAVKLKKEFDLGKLDLGGSKLYSLLASMNDEQPLGFQFRNRILSGFFRLKRAIQDYYKIGQVTTRYILIDNLHWNTKIGLDDAMYTALATGSIWAFKGSLLSYLNSQKRLKKFQINVAPDFSARLCWSRLNCILKVRIGHIILVDIFLLIHRFKNRKTAKNDNDFGYLAVKYAKSAILHQVKKWGCLNGSTGRKTKPTD